MVPAIVMAVLLIALITVAVIVVATDDDGDDDTAGTTTTAPPSSETSTTRESVSTPSSTEPGSLSSSTTTTSEPVEAPPVTVPGSAAPPTTTPGTEALDLAGVPLIGILNVSAPPNDVGDFPVTLEASQNLAILSSQDDGMVTTVEVYDPSGRRIGTWETGEPETVEGYQWSATEPLEQTGVYVLRVINRTEMPVAFELRIFDT